MRGLVLSALLLTAACFSSEDSSTYAFQATRFNELKEEITGHGTAVHLDLTEYGLDRSHYLLTCAHLVDQYERHRILVMTVWRPCQIVWKDSEMDLCVLRCEVELPSPAQLAEANPKPKDRISTIGYSKGERSKLLKGRVCDDPVGAPRMLRQASIKGFDHGCSGAGIFYDGKVAGVVTGGVPAEGGYMIEDLANFMPVRRIRMFLLYESKERK